MKKKILITGSEGFIGSHLVESLTKKKVSVKAFVQYNSFNSIGWLKNLNKDCFKFIEIHFGDIRDSGNVDKAVKDCHKLINLAALIGIPYSYKAAQSYIDTNITGTHNLLQSALKYNLKKFIQTSTSEVYGTPKIVPIKETNFLNAQSPYAASKIAADQLALSFHKSFGLPVSIIRPFNTFGPRQSLRAIIPTIISQFINPKNNKYIKLGNINTKRDFNFVQDTVNGFIKSLSNQKIIGETINLGSGFEYSIKTIVKMIEDISSKKLIIKNEKNRNRPKESEVYRLLACNKKAKKYLNWKPKYSSEKNFKKALSITYNWYKNNSGKEDFFTKEYIY